MFNSLKTEDINSNYQMMVDSAKAFCEDEDDLIALLSNLSALINFYMDNINWVGFYLFNGKELVLGPFQGLPACTRISPGKGVCGTAFAEKKPLIVEDVHQFPGHIACDSASLSELVLPFFKNGDVFGVLDLDSPKKCRFTKTEAEYLSQISGFLTHFLEK